MVLFLNKVVISLYAMLDFSLKKSEKHRGEKTVLLFQNTTESTVVYGDLIDSIDLAYHSMFFCLEKLLCDMLFMLII